VGLIAEEVSKKQKDCEEDLAKAEPALTAAQQALNTLNKVKVNDAKLNFRKFCFHAKKKYIKLLRNSKFEFIKFHIHPGVSYIKCL
jgi:hypothetical protein